MTTMTSMTTRKGDEESTAAAAEPYDADTKTTDRQRHYRNTQMPTAVVAGDVAETLVRDLSAWLSCSYEAGDE